MEVTSKHTNLTPQRELERWCKHGIRREGKSETKREREIRGRVRGGGD